MFATGVTMGLAEWIIDDTCLVFIAFYPVHYSRTENFWTWMRKIRKWLKSRFQKTSCPRSIWPDAVLISRKLAPHQRAESVTLTFGTKLWHWMKCYNGQHVGEYIRKTISEPPGPDLNVVERFSFVFVAVVRAEGRTPFVKLIPPFLCDSCQ